MRPADETALLDAALHGLAAGVPLPDAIDDAAQALDRPALAAVARRLREGSAFSQALAAEGAPAALVASARAGEASGRLEEALTIHEDALEWRVEARRRAIDASLRSLVTLGVGVVTLVLLLGLGGVPAFLDLLDRAGFAARAIRAALALPQPLPFVITALALAAIAWIAWRLVRLPGVQRLAEALPGRREHLRAMTLARASTLVRAGVPAHEALGIAADEAPRGSRVRDALRSCSRDLEAGTTPRCAEWPVLAALLSEPVPAGRRAHLLARAAGFHESERDRLSAATAELAGLAVLLLAGLLTAFVVSLAWGGYYGAASFIGV